uniref:Cohesin loading complex subunit SCC4 homolog n=1 Tax=Panagrolaimus sp. JU765 TaxID=591449 RepID=A0AC34RL45_9BILA
MSIQQPQLQMGHQQAPQTFQQPPMDHQRREDTAALSFLAMAEHFRSSDPPCFKAAAKCLIASTKTNASPLIKGHCHYQLGKLLYYYTKNLALAKDHLMVAHQIFKSLGSHLEELRLRAACMIAECALCLQETDCILPLLREEAAYTRKHPAIHGKALLLTIESLAMVDSNVALEVADMGLRYFNDLNDKVMECYFQLTKSLLYSRLSGRDEQLSQSVSEFSTLITANPNVPNIDDMRAFCYAIQLSYFLTTGMVNNSKRCLRQLQMTVQNKSKEEDMKPQFNWLRKELLTSLAYCMTALCNIQWGDYAKAIKYHTVSRNHLNELNAQMKKPEWGVIGRGHERFSAHLYFALHDAVGQMYLARAMPEKVFENATEMVKVLRVVPKDLKLFEGQIHLLLGQYFQYINLADAAEQQFIAVEKTTDDNDVIIMAKLCRCMLYLFQFKEHEFYDVFETVRYQNIESATATCKVVSQFVGAMHSYAHGRIAECKNLAADAVMTCQERDILRIQAMAMLIICRIFNCKDTETVAASKKMAQNTNDPALQAWAIKSVIDHYERRIEEEKNPGLKSHEEPYLQQLQELEKEMAQNREKALQLMPPKFSTMVDFGAELATNSRLL